MGDELNRSDSVSLATSKLWLWIVMAVIVLSLVVGGFFILVGKNSDSSPSADFNSNTLVKSLVGLDCADILPKDFMENNFGNNIEFQESYSYGLDAGSDSLLCITAQLGADLNVNFVYSILIKKYFGDLASFESEVISNYGAQKISPNYLQTATNTLFLTSTGYSVDITSIGSEVNSESKNKISNEVLSNLNNPVSTDAVDSVGGSSYSNTEAILFDCESLISKSFIDSTFKLKELSILENYVNRNLPSLSCNYVSGAGDDSRSVLISLYGGSSVDVENAYNKQLKDYSKYVEGNDFGVKSSEYNSIPGPYLPSYTSRILFFTSSGYFVSIMVSNANSDQSKQTKELAQKIVSNLK